MFLITLISSYMKPVFDVRYSEPKRGDGLWDVICSRFGRTSATAGTHKQPYHMMGDDHTVVLPTLKEEDGDATETVPRPIANPSRRNSLGFAAVRTWNRDTSPTPRASFVVSDDEDITEKTESPQPVSYHTRSHSLGIPRSASETSFTKPL